MSRLSHEDFISLVQTRADLSFESANEGTRAVLSTLAERISGGEAMDIAAELPPELGAYLEKQQGAPAESFDEADFYARVSERMGTDPRRARRVTEEVISVMENAISRGEISDAKSELPSRLKELIKTPQIR